MLPSVRVVFNIPPTLSPTPKPTFAMPTSVPWPSLLSNGQPGFVALVVITIQARRMYHHPLLGTVVATSTPCTLTAAPPKKQ